MIDREKGGDLGTQFVAFNLTRLPTVCAEKYNLQFLVSSILELKEQNSFLYTSISNLHRRFDGNEPRSGVITPSHLVSSPRRCPPTPSSYECANLDANAAHFVPSSIGVTESEFSIVGD